MAMSLRASTSVVTLTVRSSRVFTSTPSHQAIFSDFLIRLSPIQPEMGMTGTDFSMKSG